MTILAAGGSPGSGNFELDGWISLVIFAVVAVGLLASVVISFEGWRLRRRESRREIEQEHEQPPNDPSGSGLH